MFDTGGLIDPGNFAHIGFIVKDIEKSKDYFSSLFGLNRWTAFDYDAAAETMLVGDPFKIKIAGTMLGAVGIELIQPVKSPHSVWGQFLKDHGEGIHHIAYKVKDFKDTLTKLEENGAIVLVSVMPGTDMHWGYIVTEPAGIIMELMNFDLKF